MGASTLKVECDVHLSMLPGAHLARSHEDCDGLTRIQSFFQLGSPSQNARDISSSQADWVPNQPTNSLHVVIIPPPSQSDCSWACVFPVSFVKRSAVAPTELICCPSGGTTDKICFARSRISFDIILFHGRKVTKVASQVKLPPEGGEPLKRSLETGTGQNGASWAGFLPRSRRGLWEFSPGFQPREPSNKRVRPQRAPDRA